MLSAVRSCQSEVRIWVCIGNGVHGIPCVSFFGSWYMLHPPPVGLVVFMLSRWATYYGIGRAKSLTWILGPLGSKYRLIIQKRRPNSVCTPHHKHTRDTLFQTKMSEDSTFTPCLTDSFCLHSFSHAMTDTKLVVWNNLPCTLDSARFALLDMSRDILGSGRPVHRGRRQAHTNFIPNEINNTTRQQKQIVLIVQQ